MKILSHTLSYGLLACFALTLAGCSQADIAQSEPRLSDSVNAAYGSGNGDIGADVLKADKVALEAFQDNRDDGLSVAIFAGGCFWCSESDFEKIPGVIEAISGYTGGRVDNPNYKQVSYTETGHFEAVKVIFDPAQVSYRQLVDGFWKSIDPTDARGQFCDKGSSYRSAVFVTPEQAQEAQASRAQAVANKPFEQDFITPILPATTFYKAEAYHQDYYKTNSAHYQRYRRGCGRDRRLAQLWGQ